MDSFVLLSYDQIVERNRHDSAVVKTAFQPRSFPKIDEQTLTTTSAMYYKAHLSRKSGGGREFGSRCPRTVKIPNRYSAGYSNMEYQFYGVPVSERQRSWGYRDEPLWDEEDTLTDRDTVFFLKRCPNAETLSRHESPDCGAKRGITHTQ
ncbi:hypothetical protein EVAR_59496_1 [Eumeta japonica]|uniref:Uncharacterized protein n=1 Tax=Eumeta variegata TaxID=151549 RepID=A0A4C1YDV2_EUMVA|nr:hypothetical protein EVAR_59496_1 [Eumeta japonica]